MLSACTGFCDLLHAIYSYNAPCLLELPVMLYIHNAKHSLQLPVMLSNFLTAAPRAESMENEPLLWGARGPDYLVVNLTWTDTFIRTSILPRYRLRSKLKSDSLKSSRRPASCCTQSRNDCKLGDLVHAIETKPVNVTKEVYTDFVTNLGEFLIFALHLSNSI